ncbi:hypothetical protein K431DRAFT_289524 [Polychaeton citri CBS 116435]|uniref:S-adenosyl-L-methionine-dependent methyltransferase n=1 Tax=Polychaeton citri CBS 116435 TaxID=1314669 RepID=A0A9P4PWM7_9PEZI|nr:hypothetical protein K431DRAFT_289524 [Polychaeton citri CBS 116435]
MLEAVRLVERGYYVPDHDAQALVIGAGIGTAPKALIKHGVQTTIVELDPAVHEFATKYFGLPASHTKVLEDAVLWTARTARNVSKTAALSPSSRPVGRYDYIIHDVFTGGAEPLSLFSEEFLFSLRTLLSDEGIIAINYAGSLGQPLTTAVLDTVDLAFGHSCKIFSDSSEIASRWRKLRESIENEKLEESQEAFSNLVIFCRKTPSPLDKHSGDYVSQQPIAFRKPEASDYLGTISRQHYLIPRAEQEIEWHWGKAWKGLVDDSDPSDRQDILHAADAWMWEPETQSSAKKHWEVMRRVLPARIWELY